ncbi:uncharacterized protein N0V89_007480 [Didymosphaeria variabile]|uniref:Uncharacterized protein n=1 Tax=Didymosphaeria variabile TaxID=1932322 RepID=A0A9W9CAA7_9PLEO|nr:uncharacterized protein N0V89_007480 [Didymosphaeria variabile]KAJ4352133.1 hypothetical protein N0V89_007480 [Didymosphaeria variabile]
MISTSNFAIFALLGNAFALPSPRTTKLPIEAGCGELNVFYTGFTAYHPYVAAQNFSLDEVDKGLRHGAADLVKAGFNVHGDHPIPHLRPDQLV